MTRKPWPLALALVALIGAGCSDGSAEKKADANAGSESALRFAECMRDNGVGEFPDPDASGELTIDGVVNGSSLDPSSPTWEAAIRACKDLQPPGFTGDDEVTAEEQETRLEFAQCMRDHGIEDFPDPAEDAPLVDTTRIPSAAGRGALEIPGFQTAMDTCGEIFGGELGLGGQ